MSSTFEGAPRFADPILKTIVRALLGDRFGILNKPIHMDSELVGDLGIERADLGYFALALEELFDIDIANEDVIGLVSVRDAVGYVLAKRANGPDVPIDNS